MSSSIVFNLKTLALLGFDVQTTINQLPQIVAAAKVVTSEENQTNSAYLVAGFQDYDYFFQVNRIGNEGCQIKTQTILICDTTIILSPTAA
ncbi:MAG: hypothetical protein EZS28_010192 [Streblomastix strix]|uniref:Uncharacterized protein n=1 Tax=Streblomastix strix TaxID=222440 RepID=A0A5J4WH96_9EUKA|nr:MAG: hypothetical protein EZS28_010192 [Streblomastix strix]